MPVRTELDIEMHVAKAILVCPGIDPAHRGDSSINGGKDEMKLMILNISRAKQD
jgi:hypothetical protein